MAMLCYWARARACVCVCVCVGGDIMDVHRRESGSVGS